MKRGLSIDEHMNNYIKLPTYLINVDVKIDEEDKSVILLNSLLNEEFMWRPYPAGTETSLRRIYAGQKYPHVYTLSISTGKNQRRKHSGNIHSNTK